MRALLSLAAACALFASVPAVAQAPDAPATRLVLADASQAPSRPTIIDGANWRCEGSTCTASGGANQPATRACRRVNARLGDVTEFAYKGVSLSAAEIAACNA